LTLGQRLEAGPEDAAVLHEHVLAALLCDEAETLLVAEPLHGSTLAHSLQPPIGCPTLFLTAMRGRQRACDRLPQSPEQQVPALWGPARDLEISVVWPAIIKATTECPSGPRVVDPHAFD